MDKDLLHKNYIKGWIFLGVFVALTVVYASIMA